MSKFTTLGQLIKKVGYTQKAVQQQLKEKGANVNYTHFNRWCKDVYTPKYDFIYEALAEILREDVETVKNCFKENRVNNEKQK